MLHNFAVQLIAAAILVVSLAGSGFLLNPIMEETQERRLRYTDEPVDGAPPIVAIGTTIGALRGIIVDVLWLRIQLMKEQGQYYQAQTDAELITKLQPRFAPVWSFHGHNMAYNISVATHTREERWSWVKKGIDLVRTQGLRYNPNSIELYKDLAFWFAHKIEGVSDDAHLYYKREFAREWHELLGPPPYAHDRRIEWMKVIADAPDRFEFLSDDARALFDELTSALAPTEQVFAFNLSHEFLKVYSNYQAIKRSSFSQLDNTEARLREAAKATTGELNAKLFVALDDLITNPEYADAWKELLAFTRKKVLRDNYNMSAQYMYEFTRDLGPIDWRHASAHSLYWARVGSLQAEKRAHNEDMTFKIINNDRMQSQAMQDLARYGLITYDPMANEMPSRLPDTRWIRIIDRFFEHLYVKHQNVDGWGPDNFIAFHKHFLESSVRELYRLGDLENAQSVLDRLDSLYGSGALIPNPEYKQPLETFVMKKTFEEYDMQPHVATTDVQNALYYGIRAGLGRGNRDVYEHAKQFADKVLTYFKTNEINKFVNKFGEARIAGIIGDLEEAETTAFYRVMVDQQAALSERLQIWHVHATADMRVKTYDLILPQIAPEILRHQYFGQPIREENGRQLEPIEHVQRYFPEPAGIEQYRAQMARMMEQQRQQDENRARIQAK